MIRLWRSTGGLATVGTSPAPAEVRRASESCEVRVECEPCQQERTTRRPDRPDLLIPDANHASPSRRRSVCVAYNRPSSRRCHCSHDLCRCVVLSACGRFLYRRHRTSSRRGNLLLGNQPVHTIAHSADIGGCPNTVDWIYHDRNTDVYEHIRKL